MKVISIHSFRVAFRVFHYIIRKSNSLRIRECFYFCDSLSISGDITYRNYEFSKHVLLKSHIYITVSKKKWKWFRYTILELISGFFIISFERAILCAYGDVFIFVIASVFPEILRIEQMSNGPRRAGQLFKVFFQIYHFKIIFWQTLLTLFDSPIILVYVGLFIF